MNTEEVLEYLCMKDPRSPYYMDLYDLYEGDNIPIARTNCHCDNCHRGLDKLALEILRLQGEER